MGVDVGSRLHVVVVVREGERRRMVHCDSVRTFAELDGLMARYDVAQCVVDANPETREAQAFAARHRGRVWLAYYPHWSDDQRSELAVWDRERGVVKINRTAALDTVVKRVEQRWLVLSRNARELGGSVDRAGVGEFYRHMGSPIRVIADDARGNPVARYEQNGPDHYAHAVVYAEVASAQQPREAGVLMVQPRAAAPVITQRRARRGESPIHSLPCVACADTSSPGVPAGHASRDQRLRCLGDGARAHGEHADH
jgi:hypothetical protein